MIREFLEEGLEIEKLFVTNKNNWIGQQTIEISEAELKKISFLTTTNHALALFKKPKLLPTDFPELTVALDALRDPGNLGTIIRLCDWFGIRNLVCSADTVDCFNPKVVQASMGSLARVHIHYLDLEIFLKKSSLPVYGGFMDGTSIYTLDLPTNAIVVLGNEANGISKSIENLVSNRISIPRFGTIQKTESLNVATAGAIMLSEFRRRQ